jgi:imidazolonepropionase-like amidohydrolase
MPGLIDGHSHLTGDLEYVDVPAIGMTAEREILVGVGNAAATVVTTEMMGWADRVGRLSVGHYADLLAVPGDPFAAADGSGLDTLRAPVLMMKGWSIVRDDRRVRTPALG